MFSRLVLIINKYRAFFSRMFYRIYCKGAVLDPVAKTFEINVRFGRCCVTLIILYNVFKADKCYLDQSLARFVMIVVVLLYQLYVYRPAKKTKVFSVSHIHPVI